MKFIKLEILNLASLDRPEGEAICFEEGALGQSHIFSIVGPTGSGKSTLLDAICLPLYDRAPRYPKFGRFNAQKFKVYGESDEDEKNRPAPTDRRNILTRGKKLGYSKLTFLANDGTLYRAEWHISRGTKNIADPTTRLYKLVAGQGTISEQVADWSLLPQIIGLEYEQFLQTVLIAQGSFANFLAADEDTRYTLLEKLIGCGHLYTDLAARIKDKREQAELAFNLATSEVATQSQAILPDAELQAVQTQIQELQIIEQHEQAELTQVGQALGWHDQQELLCQQLAQSQQAYEQAQQQLLDFAPQAARLALHDATVPAVDLHRDLSNCQAKLATLEQSLSQLEQSIGQKQQALQQEVDVALKQLQQAQQQAAQQLDQQRPHINRARTIQAQLTATRKAQAQQQTRCSEAQQAQQRAAQQLVDNQQAIQQAQSRHEQATRQLDQVLQSIQQCCQQDQQQVQAATTSHEQAKRQLDLLDAQQLQQACTQADQTLNQLLLAIHIQSERQSLAQQKSDLQRQQQQLTQRNQQIASLLPSYRIDQLTDELTTLRNAYTLLTSQDWELHRQQLHEGAPCPLCGSTQHPYCLPEAFAPVRDEMQALIQQKQVHLRQQTQAHQQLLIEQSQNEGLLRGHASSLAQLEQKASALASQCDELSSLHPHWPNDAQQLLALQPQAEAQALSARQALDQYNALSRQTQALRHALDKALLSQRQHEQQAIQQRQQAEQQVHEAHTHLQTQQGQTANLQTLLDERSQALTIAQQALQTVAAEVKSLEQALHNEVGHQDPDRLEQTLLQAKEDADRAMTDQTEAIALMRQELERLQGSQATTRQQHDQELSLRQSLTQALDQWLTAYNADPQHAQPLTAAHIAELYATPDAWDEIRTRQQQLTQALTAAQTTLTNATQAHQAHQQNQPQQSREELQARQQELQSHDHAPLINLRARLQLHHEALAKVGPLYQEQARAEQLLNDWKEINEAIGTDGKTLRKIAQCYTLRFLIAHANAEIRKFNHRYELMQVRNSLAIRVIDHDRADDIRDTSSLSGGETFIVSLGLALGLSSLSSRNISFQNLFIDEGFGTLDPDTLATVIDSLAMLQSSQGKKVGVISHTDTMSERISTQIRIIKNGTSGSSHIEVYPS